MPPTALNWSSTVTASVAWPTMSHGNDEHALYLPSLCVLLEIESESAWLRSPTPGLTAAASAAAAATSVSPVTATAASAAWTATASTVGDVLFYAFPASLVLAVVSSLLSLCVFLRLTSSSHECYLAAFYAAAVVRLLVNVVQALPVYMLHYVDSHSDVENGGDGNSMTSGALAALTSAARHLAAVDYWLRVACTWLLVAAAVQRALSTLCNCGAPKIDDEQPWSNSSRGDRLRGSAAAFLVCCFALVLALPQFWMYEAASAAEVSNSSGAIHRWSGAGSGGGRGGKENLAPPRPAAGSSTAAGKQSTNEVFACAATGELRRSSNTVTPDFLAYDWCAMLGRFVVPYVLLPILLPSLARGSDEERERRRQQRQQKKQQQQQQQRQLSTDEEHSPSSPSSPLPGQQAKFHEAALLRAAAREEQDFDRLLLLTALLYLLLAAPTNVLRTLVDRPLSGGSVSGGAAPATAVLAPLDRHLAGLIYIMADVLLNLFFAIAFVLHTLCSVSFRRALRRLCCCACRRCKAPTARRHQARDFDYDDDGNDS